MAERRPRRINGLSRPYSSAQIGAWVAYIVSIIQFALFISPVVPIHISIPISILFIVGSCGAVLYFGMQTLLIDPVDIHLYQSLKQREEIMNEEVRPLDNEDEQEKRTTAKPSLEYKLNPYLQTNPTEEMKQCWICDAQVAVHSMHCKYCNKCVYRFDHHCLWLNTCIGKANYKQFFNTMVSLWCMEFVHCIIQVGLIIDIILDGPTKQRAGTYIAVGNNSTVLLIILIGFACFNVLSMFLLGQLIFLHMSLQKQNITTYEYIVQDSKKKRELERCKGDLERQRITEIELAKSNHQLVRQIQLQCGGFCRNRIQIFGGTCDPLSIPKPYEPDPNDGFAAVLGGASSNNNTITDKNDNNSKKQANAPSTSNESNPENDEKVEVGDK